jgi:hypothetical protein
MLKPLVFIPGHPGSELIDNDWMRKIWPSLRTLLDDKERLLERLKGPQDPDEVDGVFAGPPIRRVAKLAFIDVSKQAITLYRLLEDLGYDLSEEEHVKPLGWDWRKPVYGAQAQTDLRWAIKTLFERFDRPVTLLVHSTGGLVARAFLERVAVTEPELLEMVEEVIALGVPWAGTVKPVRVVGLGEAVAGGFISATEARDALGHSHAAYDIMPVGRQQIALPGEQPPPLFLDENGDQADARALGTRWLKPAFRPYATRSQAMMSARTARLQLSGHELKVTNLAGWGRETDTQARVQPGRGNPRLVITQSDLGDGTVPWKSAGWLRGATVQTFTIPWGSYGGAAATGVHSQLWAAPSAREILEQRLRETSRTPFVWVAMDADDLLHSRKKVRYRVVGLDPDGLPLDAGKAFFARVGSRKEGKKAPLDGWGRATLTFSRTSQSPPENRFYTPVVVEWKYEGKAFSRRFDLSFLV